jgi:hypothetical protein
MSSWGSDLACEELQVYAAINIYFLITMPIMSKVPCCRHYYMVRDWKIVFSKQRSCCRHYYMVRDWKIIFSKQRSCCRHYYMVRDWKIVFSKQRSCCRPTYSFIFLLKHRREKWYHNIEWIHITSHVLSELRVYTYSHSFLILCCFLRGKAWYIGIIVFSKNRIFFSFPCE